MADAAREGLLPVTVVQAQRAIMPLEVFACERSDDLMKGMRLFKDRIDDIFIPKSTWRSQPRRTS